MTCQRCVQTVTAALQETAGVTSVHVSLEAKEAEVSASEDVQRSTLVASIEQAGFTTEPPASTSTTASPRLAAIGGPAVSSSPPSENLPSHAPTSPSPSSPTDDNDDDGGVGQAPKAIRLDVAGMHCAACVARVEQQLESVPGVARASCTLTPPRAVVYLQADATPTVTEAALTDAVAAAGYRASAAKPLRDAFAPMEQSGRQWLLRFVAAAVALAFYFLASPTLLGPATATWAKWAAATVTMFVTGQSFVRGAIQQARRAAMNMDTLVATSTMVAYAAGTWAVMAPLWTGAPSPIARPMVLMDVVMILCFVSFGKWLEAKSRSRATRTLQSLLALAPNEATVIRDGEAIVVHSESVRPGETVVIAAGQRIPLDATIVEGQSAVDESWLTGESVPVTRKAGDSVYAGSVNGSQVLTVTVDRASQASWVAKIVDQVQQTLETKAPIQRIADQAASWFTPVVFTIAFVSAAGWWLADSPGAAIQVLITVLIVACPCALGLATPIAIVVASSKAAEQGVLFRDAESLEQLGRSDLIIFDKTGTLTEGKLRVVAITPAVDLAPQLSPDDLLALAAGAAQHSTHPVAKAVVAEAQRRSLARPLVSGAKEHSGDGVECQIQTNENEPRQRLLVGNRGWLVSRQVELPTPAPPATQLEVALGNVWQGNVELADEPRAEAYDVVQKLKALGVDTLLLSGDATERVALVARDLGFEAYRAGAKPDEKLKAVNDRRASGQRVAMLGDGVNDGPSLSAADVGIAMGCGADISVEAARVVLSRGDLTALPAAFLLSRRTRRIIFENLGWAVIYNLALIPWAAGWLSLWNAPSLPPSAAAAAMALSSVTVVANSLRLRN